MSPNKSYSQTIRGKDIASFLWCCSQLNCKLTNDQLCIIENNLIQRVHNNEFSYFVDQLVDACLSLWILGYKSRELLHNAVKLKSEHQSKRLQPKVDSRLTVLLSAAQIEEPDWCTHMSKGHDPFNLNFPVPRHVLNSSMPYDALVSQFTQDPMVNSAKVVCPINGINIPGIYVKYSSTPVFIELLTKQQTLQFSQEPVGILRLKINLLQSMGHNVKVLSASDLTQPLNVNDLLHSQSNSELNENIINA